MNIVDLAIQPDDVQDAAALMLVEQFVEPRGWPDRESAMEEVANILAEGFAFAMLDGATLAGWIGGLPEYHGRVWELHPLVVHRDFGTGESDDASCSTSKRRSPGVEHSRSCSERTTTQG